MNFQERNDEEVARRSLLLQLVDSLVADGMIDPNGKDLDLLIREALKIWNASSKKIQISDDSMPEIEDKAREFRKNNELYFSVLFCATWFEHWINGIILKKATQRGLRNQDILAIMREANHRAKTGWLLALLDLPPLMDEHKKSVHRILELRNGFVHYKWNSVLLEEVGSVEKYENAIDSFLSVISSLKEYEIQNIYHGYRAKDQS